MSNEELQRELDKAQIILGFVLYVGGTVEIPRSVLEAGLPAGSQIAIEENLQNDTVVVKLETE